MNLYEPVFSRAELFLLMFAVSLAAVIVCVWIDRRRSAEVAALQVRVGLAEVELKAMRETLAAYTKHPPNEFGAAA